MKKKSNRILIVVIVVSVIILVGLSIPSFVKKGYFNGNKRLSINASLRDLTGGLNTEAPSYSEGCIKTCTIPFDACKVYCEEPIDPKDSTSNDGIPTLVFDSECLDGCGAFGNGCLDVCKDINKANCKDKCRLACELGSSSLMNRCKISEGDTTDLNNYDPDCLIDCIGGRNECYNYCDNNICSKL